MGCSKAAWTSPVNAEKARQDLMLKRQTLLRVYECPKCMHYHLTSVRVDGVKVPFARGHKRAILTERDERLGA